MLDLFFEIGNVYTLMMRSHELQSHMAVVLYWINMLIIGIYVSFIIFCINIKLIRWKKYFCIFATSKFLRIANFCFFFDWILRQLAIIFHADWLFCLHLCRCCLCEISYTKGNMNSITPESMEQNIPNTKFV